jgi:hypothetical protein
MTPSHFGFVLYAMYLIFARAYISEKERRGYRYFMPLNRSMTYYWFKNGQKKFYSHINSTISFEPLRLAEIFVSDRLSGLVSLSSFFRNWNEQKSLCHYDVRFRPKGNLRMTIICVQNSMYLFIYIFGA